MSEIIKIKNLNLSYGKKEVLKSINLNIFKNHITAISGPSGIGKSSLLLVLNQMIREFERAKCSGEVFLNEDGEWRDILKFKEKELPALRKNIVYVSQHPDLLPFSIFENLYFGLKLQGIKKDSAKSMIKEALEKTFLYDEIHDRLHGDASMLSGGQQQRLILARALVLKPKILLLDEPTSSLNEELSSKVEDMLVKLKRETTIVMISHFKSQILKIADSVLNLA